MLFRKTLRIGVAAAAFAATALVARAQGPIAPPAVAHAGFRAVHYDVNAVIAPASQTLAVRATVQFEAAEGSHVIQAELHPNLRINSVTDAAGKPLNYQRDSRDPLEVLIDVGNAVNPGQKVEVVFDYAGQLQNNEDNSPIKGVRLAAINADAAYLLLPARWFPLTNYPTNRYTGIFKIQVPENFQVAGTGKAGETTTVSGTATLPSVIKPGAPPPAPTGQKSFTFRCDSPAPWGSFAAAVYQGRAVDADGVKIPVLAFPASAKTVQLYGDAAGKMITTFTDAFGALPDPSLTVAEFPDGSVTGFSGPGLALISERQWLVRGNTRELSRLVAGQWFGSQVLPATRADVWVTDGLARYSEALYAEEDAGREGANRAIEDFTVGALMFEGTTPISQAQQLQPFTPQYISIVQDKGAAVFNMLRSLMGDSAFHSLLKDFYAKFAGKNAQVSDMEQMAQSHMKAPPTQVATISNSSDGKIAPAGADALPPFFAQWLDSTGAPQFSMEYTIFRNPKGFRVVGKIKQNIDTFNMPVEIEVQTEGNPEFKMVQVVGTETTFNVDTFGRPKPGGVILDPHNYLLKSSSALQVRAIVARGEALAGQGKLFDAVQEYQRALDLEPNNALALFRMGEAFFYQKNYAAAANSFRGAIGGVTDLSTKWVEVWSHIYMGKIYDLTGQRDRAVNEYNQAIRLKDDTGGAQDEAHKYLTGPYKDAQ